MKRRPAVRLLALLAVCAAAASGQEVTISDAVVVEGDAGVVQAMFVVDISFPGPAAPEPLQPYNISYSTRDGTATAADGDYLPVTNGLLNFPAAGMQTILIDVSGDLKVEDDETFFVDIGTPDPNSPLEFLDPEGMGTIQNDDATALSIDDVAVTEGDSGTVDATFAVTLSAPSDFTVTADFASRDGTARTADGDYLAASGSLTFAPGEISKPVTVTVNGDLEVEPDEDFFVDVTNPDGASIADGTGAGTIANDDIPALSIDDVAVTEGDAGTVAATFTVYLSTPSASTVTADFASRDGTATVADGDYQPASGRLSFAPGVTSRTLTVTVNGDPKVEADEGFFVDLSNPSGATIADSTGEGTIGNDDATAVSIGDAALAEGDSGGTDMRFPVTLTAPSDSAVSVRYVTRDGNATIADQDYRAREGRLSFAPGETERAVIVPIVGDTRVEPDEQFQVALERPRGAVLGDALGIGTIRNDDGVAGSVIRLASVPAVGEGAGSAVITVERSGGSSGAATVDFATADGSAAAGADYGATAGTLAWGDGESGSRSFSVPILDDNLSEGDETVIVRLTNPSGAALGSPAELDLVIRDDDRASRLEAVGGSERQAGVEGLLDLQALASREDGSPVQGASVVWQVVEGDAELVGDAETTSDAAGLASQQVQLGPTPGRVVVTAEIPATGQVVTFEIAVEGDLDELFDPATSPGESSVARALNQACFDAGPEFAELCDYLFGLDPDQQRILIGELTPSEAGALGDISLRSPYVQLMNLREHLAARRRGGSSGSRIALGLGGRNLPLGLLISSFSGADSERLFAARIDAAMFQQEGEGPAAAAPPPEIDEPSRWSFFLSGRAEIGDRPTGSHEQGFDLDTLGLTAGVDYRLRARLIVGGALGFVDTSTKLDGDGGGLDVQGFSVSAFGTYFRERFWSDLILTYSAIDYEAARNIDLPVPFQGRSRFTASGSPEGRQLAIDWGAGYDATAGSAILTGFGRLSYIDAEVDGFSEQGAGPFNLVLRDQRLESLLAEAGFEAVWALSRGWGVLQPVLRASIFHELEDDARVVIASFAADPLGTELRIPTDQPDRDYFRVAAGLTATLARGRALYLLYETDLERDDLDLYSLAAGLRLEF